MDGLEDKYITSENMWVLNLPKPLIQPVFKVVWFFCKIKYTLAYLGFIWHYNVAFDLDYFELLLLMEYKLNRMRKQLKSSGNLEGSKQVEQTLLYLDQHQNAEKYVTLPKELQGKDVGELIHIGIDDKGQVNIDLDMSDETASEYKEYLDELVDYEDESWSLFWDSLKQKATNWL